MPYLSFLDSLFFFFFSSLRVSGQPGPTMIDGLASAENPEKRKCNGDFRDPFTSQVILSALKGNLPWTYQIPPSVSL